jgi:hypothetical protein
VFIQYFLEILMLWRIEYHFDDFALNGIAGLSKCFPDNFNLLEGKCGLNLVAVFLVKGSHLFSLSLFRIFYKGKVLLFSDQ